MLGQHKVMGLELRARSWGTGYVLPPGVSPVVTDFNLVRGPADEINMSDVGQLWSSVPLSLHFRLV